MRSRHLPIRTQPHLTLHNFTQKALPLIHANRNEIHPSGRVIIARGRLSNIAIATQEKCDRLLGLYFLCGVVIEFANILLEDLVLKTENLTSLQHQRRLTIIPLFKSVMKYTIYFAAAVYILNLSLD
jgi:hypothetical protein